MKIKQTDKHVKVQLEEKEKIIIQKKKDPKDLIITMKDGFLYINAIPIQKIND